MTRTGKYVAKDLEWTGLSGDQTDVNGFQVRLKSYASGGNNIFTAVWVKVFYRTLEIDVQVDMQVDDSDCSSIGFLKYSHKTNISIDVDKSSFIPRVDPYYYKIFIMADRLLKGEKHLAI